MKLIKCLCEMIEEELEGAEHYAKCALKYKDEHPTLAKTLYDISTDEMRHVNLLHDEVVKVIETYRRGHEEPPEAMQAVYDYLHEKHIEEAKEVRMYQDEYRGVS